jgi:hypothetical protein
MELVFAFFEVCHMQRKCDIRVILVIKNTASPTIEFVLSAIFRTTAFVYSFELRKLELLGNSKISKLK